MARIWAVGMLGSNTLTFGPRSTDPDSGGAAGGAAYTGPATSPVSTRARRPVTTPARDHVVVGLRMCEISRERALSARGPEPVQSGAFRSTSQPNWETDPGPPSGVC